MPSSPPSKLVRAAALIACALLLCSACSTKSKLQAASAAPPVQPCARVAPGTFADPQAAYTAYAAAINRNDWCAAINAFEFESRVEVAITAFRVLVVAAAGASEHRAEYRAQLDAVCRQYNLPFKSDQDLLSLFARALSDGNQGPNGAAGGLEQERSVAAKNPEAMYADVMSRFMAANPAAQVNFKPQLKAVDFEVLTTSGTAERSDGQTVKLLFKQTDQGWVLTALPAAE